MNDSNASALDDGWKESDFSEPASSDIDLDDPWGSTLLGKDIAESYSRENGNNDMPAQCTSEHAIICRCCKG